MYRRILVVTTVLVTAILITSESAWASRHGHRCGSRHRHHSCCAAQDCAVTSGGCATTAGCGSGCQPSYGVAQPAPSTFSPTAPPSPTTTMAPAANPQMVETPRVTPLPPPVPKAPATSVVEPNPTARTAEKPIISSDDMRDDKPGIEKPKVRAKPRLRPSDTDSSNGSSVEKKSNDDKDNKDDQNDK